MLGNQRLISTWPVRTGPVLKDGTVYFTAGIWSFMGIFVHAVDAETGKAVWTNSSESVTYTVQPHNSPAFAGFIPRGHLAATEAGMIAPGGRTEPGRYDLKTGRLLGFAFGGKGRWCGRTSPVIACGDWFFADGAMRQISDGKTVLSTKATICDGETLYGTDKEEIFAQALAIEEHQVEKTDRKGKQVKVRKCSLKPLWKLSLSGAPGRLFLKAGSRFYTGEDGRVAALETNVDEGRVRIAWSGSFEGSPWNMLAADDRLFVVTTAGRIYCWGAAEGQPRTYDGTFAEGPREENPPAAPDRAIRRAEKILKTAGTIEGYCVVLGLGSGELAQQLVRMSAMHVIAIDPDSKKVDRLRRRMNRAGLYGGRIAAHQGNPLEYPLPPYLAGLVVVEDLPAAGIEAGVPLVKAVFGALRPYGGMAWLQVDAPALQRLVTEARLPAARVKAVGQRAALLVREGPLPGAADWTHQYADAANSVVSGDRRVKAPLGLLWFGGPSNDEVLPRHGHGPSPQVAAGRLFIEGRNMLRALDIYTGRLLWQKDLPDLGKFHDNTAHQPGANEIGGNYVSLPDAVYVVYGDAILKLDPASGKQTEQFTLKARPEDPRPNWGFIAAWEDLLIGTSTPVTLGSSDKVTKPTVKDLLTPVRYSSASRRLVVLDRHSGRELWDREAKYGFRHNNIAIGGGRLFCIDGMSRDKQELLKRRGIDPEDYAPRLTALDVRGGKEIWSTGQDVFGTFLNYSVQHDVLLQAGSAFRDRARDESAAGMVAYRGKDGAVLWKDLKRTHAGPCILHHDAIIAQGPAYQILTGKPKMREHPLTGEPVPWTFTRNYGCNTAVASEHLITFRSAAAGFFDVLRDGGTGNLGGFKSGCTSNLIVAGGLLNAPEYTRTCSCNYQNQTSLAVVHDPRVETWTFNALGWSGRPIRRVGINFGAPGDRRTDEGILWLDYPSRGGPSPDVPVELEPQDPQYFCHHGSRFARGADGGGLRWVAASGVVGLRRATITLAKDDSAGSRRYTVRLHFAEPEDVRPGERVFDVRLQDKEVLKEFDIVKRCGTMTAMVEEIRGVEVTDKLTVSLKPAAGDEAAGPILCGLEILAEGW